MPVGFMVWLILEQNVSASRVDSNAVGWLDMLYTPERYMTRGKLSRAKFEKTCLAEYAEVFRTVCLDAGFYQFPSPKMLDGYLSQVPSDFRMSLKVAPSQKRCPPSFRNRCWPTCLVEGFLNRRCPRSLVVVQGVVLGAWRRRSGATTRRNPAD